MSWDEAFANRAAEDEKVRSVTAWRQRVGANLDRLSYTERRPALEALEVQVRVYSNRIPDENGEHYPRWTVTLGLVR